MTQVAPVSQPCVVQDPAAQRQAVHTSNTLHVHHPASCNAQQPAGTPREVARVRCRWQQDDGRAPVTKGPLPCKLAVRCWYDARGPRTPIPSRGSVLPGCNSRPSWRQRCRVARSRRARYHWQGAGGDRCHTPPRCVPSQLPASGLTLQLLQRHRWGCRSRDHWPAPATPHHQNTWC